MKRWMVSMGLALLAMGGKAGAQAAVVPAKTSEPSPVFRAAQKQGVWWLQSPEGKPMFSLGADCIGRGATEKTYQKAKPEYASFRHYASDAEWARDTMTRLRAWHFNTLGGWSDTDILNADAKTALPYAVVLHLGLIARAPWSDVFGPDVPRLFDEYARKQILPVRNDPHLIGYFADNELGWWGDTLFTYFLQQPASNATRQVLLNLLRARYSSDFARLQKDFNTGEARSFTDLDAKANLTLVAGARGIETVQAFVSVLAKRYYQLAHDAIRRYDTQHLLLGDRYAGYCPPEVAAASRNLVDVVSSNYGADWKDGHNARFFLEMLNRVTNKPVMVTEFYFCARENNSGNKNTGNIFPTVNTQRERTAGFLQQLDDFAAEPFIIGAHWFQYTDEPAQGRGDGEDYNMGLVDVENRPYPELTAAAANWSPEAAHRKALTAVPRRKLDAVPPAPPHPETGLETWDKTHGYVVSTKIDEPDCGDLYVTWKPDALYVAAIVADFVEPKLYPSGKIPDGERITLTLRVGTQTTPLTVRFGPGSKGLHSDVSGTGSAQVQHWTHNGATRFTVIVRLPAVLFGKSVLRADTKITLRAMLATHSRGHATRWQQPLTLAH